MKLIKLLILLFMNIQILFAGNLQISNIILGNPNTAAKYRMITFNITWNNSWRTSGSQNNWDAAWVFIKYRAGNGEWQHATLSTLIGEHVNPAGTMLDAPTDGKGVFIYPSFSGRGTFNALGISLRWNYSLDNVTDDAQINIKVLGLEMVFIPQGSFFAGDNTGSGASFQRGYNDNRAWYIYSERPVNVTNTASNGYFYTSSRDFIVHQFNTGEDATGSNFIIPADFPKGYRAIYCMKYELSQQQYVDFLNSLTSKQASSRYDAANYNKWGYTILLNNGVFSTTQPDRACGYFNPQDGMAYADWAGLRPMSELEFEKICRGSGNKPIEGEFAWGTTKSNNVVTVPDFKTSVTNIKNSNANCFYEQEGLQDIVPMQIGVFEREYGNRELNGATFYGVMEMSGNLDENCIGVGNQYGRAFTYKNGDGQIDIDGYTNEINWPGREGRGSGYRGGCLGQEEHVMQVADRFEANVEINNTHRHIPWGFRAVRTCTNIESSVSITANAGTGGTISPCGIVPKSGIRMTFSISANTGYSILAVIVDGVSVGVVSEYVFDNIISNHDITVLFSSLSGNSGDEILPKDFVLHQNYPNPFNPLTKIKYELPHAANINLKIYNIFGQEVKTLINETRPAGIHYAYWDGTEYSGKKACSGTYIYILRTGDFIQSKKMIYLK